VKLLGRPIQAFGVRTGAESGGTLLDAAMAALALVLSADDRSAVPDYCVAEEALDRFEALKGLDPRSANNLFNSFTSGIRNQGARGRNNALNAVAAIRGDAKVARSLLEICEEVGRSHGGLSRRRMSTLDKISTALLGAPTEKSRQAVPRQERKEPAPHLITIGNEKGGTGKSTTAMHLAVALLKLGYTVGTLDLDGRQATLSRYLTNRRTLAKTLDREVVFPAHRRIECSQAVNRNEAEAEERARLTRALAELTHCRFVIIDTPGSASHLSRLAHANADTLITPINDTLLDLDILAHIDPQRREVLAPSAYCEMIWEQKKRRLSAARKPLDWIVMRNRLSHIESRNKRAVADLLAQLAKRIGFRCASGFGERVVFHELFLTGLTVLDLPDDRVRGWGNASLSHARREIRDLLLAVGVPERKVQQADFARAQARG
jgi:chromosome partitioning protein